MNRVKFIFSVILFFGAVSACQASDRTLPFRLRVLDYDVKLDAVLVSGDFANKLQKPLKALRGELILKDRQSGSEITLLIEHQAKRTISPGEWGVWSVWIQMDDTIPEHVFLKQAKREQLQTTFKPRRALYSDGSQQAF